MFYYFLQFLEKKLVLLISTYKVFFIGIFYLYSCQMPGIASVCFSWVVILSWTQVLNLVFAKVSPHNFIKVSLLTAYNSIYKFDIICLAETFLNLKTFQMAKIWTYQVSQTPSVGEFASTSRNIQNVSYNNQCICFQIAISNKPYHLIDHLANLVMNSTILF